MDPEVVGGKGAGLMILFLMITVGYLVQAEKTSLMRRYAKLGLGRDKAAGQMPSCPIAEEPDKATTDTYRKARGKTIISSLTKSNQRLNKK